MELLIVIVLAILMAIINYCYMQRYHNIKGGKNSGVQSFFKPVTPHRIMLFLIMLLCIITVSIYIVVMNPEANTLFFMRRVFCYSILWPVAAIDAQEHKIPNKLLLIGLVYKMFILIPEAVLFKRQLLSILLSEVIVTLLILVIGLVCRLIIKNGICMGDIKLMMVMALLLGSQSFFNAMFISMWIVFLEAVGLLISKKKQKTDAIAFAPSVLIGTTLSMILTGC